MTATVHRTALQAACRVAKRSSTSRLISTLSRISRVYPPSHSPVSFHASRTPSLLSSRLQSSTHPHVLCRLFASPAKRSLPTLNSTLRRFYFLVHPDLFHSHPEQRAVNEQNMQHFLGFITAMKQTNNDAPWPPAQHTNLTFYIRRREGGGGDSINTALSFIEYNEAQDKRHSHHAKQQPRRKAAQRRPSTGTGDFHVLPVTLSTNGGNCRGLVERQLRHLFAMLGLPEEFRWDDEYWQQKPPAKRGTAEAEGQEAEYEYA